MNIMINERKRTIEITKEFANMARVFGSDEYKMLKEARNDFPNYKVVERSAGKRTNKFKGLTTAYMEKYIKGHNPENLSDFYLLRGLDEEGNIVSLASMVSYGELKSLFLKKYPEFNEYSNKVHEILKSA